MGRLRFHLTCEIGDGVREAEREALTSGSRTMGRLFVLVLTLLLLGVCFHFTGHAYVGAFTVIGTAPLAAWLWMRGRELQRHLQKMES